MDAIRRYGFVLWRSIGPAARDVGFIAVISLIPLLFGRLLPVVQRKEANLANDWLWSLMTNGQLAFYAVGTLASISLVIFKGETLPSALRYWFGLLTFLFLCFICFLIGVDPTLANAPLTFVGVTSFWIYLATQIMAIFVSSFDQFGLSGALAGGDASAAGTQRRLAARRREGQQ